MNPLSKIIDQKKAALEAGTPISQDSYDRWLDNECTKRLFAEIEINILSAYDEMRQSNIVQMEAVIASCNELINWKPLELETNE